MDRLDWDDDEVKTWLRGRRGGRIRILGLAAIEVPAEDDATTTQPFRRLGLDDSIDEWSTDHLSVKVEPAQVRDAGAPAREVEVCALVPVQSRPSRIEVSLDLDDFLEDWEADATEPMDPKRAKPRLLLDVSSRHAPFEAWPDEDAAVAALKISHRGLERPRLDQDDAPLGLSPDTWVPAMEKPSRRVETLTPTVGPRSEGRAGGWLVLAALLALAVGGTWWLWPHSGALRVDLVEHESVPEVDVFVDGVRRCESTPCVVRELAPGNHLVKIVAHGRASPPPRELAVFAGQETAIELSLADAAQGVALSSPQEGIIVAVDGRERGALPVTLDDLSPGEHVLLFTADGRRAAERRIEVTAGEIAALEVKLEALPPRLRVELTPADASIELRRNGHRTMHAGGWPRTIELARGEWQLVAYRHGYAASAHKLVLGDGEQIVRIQLVPARDDGDIYWR